MSVNVLYQTVPPAERKRLELLRQGISQLAGRRFGIANDRVASVVHVDCSTRTYC